MSAVENARRLLAEGRNGQALDQLEHGAAVDDSASYFELGVWCLEGRHVPRDLRRSRECFVRAAELGNAAAASIHISFTAIGVGGRPDWSGALGLLRELATTDAFAAEQIALLERMQLSPSGDPLAERERQDLSAEPEARTFDRFFSKGECAYLAARARPLLQPSVVVDPATGRLRPHPIRTSEGAMFPWASEDLVIHALNRRIAAASRTEVAVGEPLQVLRYAPGQEYRPHSDALPGADNQRVLTMLVYLNDGYEGGETLFTRTGLKFAGRTGDALLFRNARPDGAPDEMAQHAGLPVTRGEKFVASRWIRQRPLVPS